MAPELYPQTIEALEDAEDIAAAAAARNEDGADISHEELMAELGIKA